MDEDLKLLQRLADCGGMEMEFLELKRDAERYRWLRDHPLCSVGYRFKPRTGKTEWRMRKEGEYWGQWWPTHEQAVDHAMALDKEGERARSVGAA